MIWVKGGTDGPAEVPGRWSSGRAKGFAHKGAPGLSGEIRGALVKTVGR